MVKGNENSDATGGESSGDVSLPEGDAREWNRILKTSAFDRLVREKRKFVNPVLFSSLTLFTVMTILATFTTLLDGRVFGSVTWGFLYNIVLFVAAFALSLMYGRRAKRWDGLSEQARREASGHRGSK